MPSTKVLTQLLTTIAVAVVMILANDQSWLDFLPDWAAAVAGPAIGAIAAYLKRETNPAPSSFPFVPLWDKGPKP